MTITTASIASIANEFAVDYGVVSLDFVWTAEDGITSYTVYSTGSEANTLTTHVPAFSYISDADVERVTELIMTVLNETDWGVSNISEIGGVLSIGDTTPIFEGEITTISDTCIQY